MVARAALVPIVISLVAPATTADAAPLAANALEPRAAAAKKVTAAACGKKKEYLTANKCVKAAKCPKGTRANSASHTCQAINKAPVVVVGGAGPAVAPATVYVTKTATVSAPAKTIINNVVAPAITVTLTAPAEEVTTTLDAITVTAPAPPALTTSVTQTLSISETETIDIFIQQPVPTTVFATKTLATTTVTSPPTVSPTLDADGVTEDCPSGYFGSTNAAGEPICVACTIS